MRRLGDRIGLLRERVTLQSQAQTRDEIGAQTTAWTTVATVWARVTPASAREIQAAGRDEQVRDFKCVLRQRADVSVTAALRLVWRNRVFDIRGVRNADERREFLELDLFERRA